MKRRRISLFLPRRVATREAVEKNLLGFSRATARAIDAIPRPRPRAAAPALDRVGEESDDDLVPDAGASKVVEPSEFSASPLPPHLPPRRLEAARPETRISRDFRDDETSSHPVGSPSSASAAPALPPPPPDMESIAAAAAAAADDSHPGLDLPLLTFSCIVGIKLSQATYYLRSHHMVADLLARMAEQSRADVAARAVAAQILLAQEQERDAASRTPSRAPSPPLAGGGE